MHDDDGCLNDKEKIELTRVIFEEKKVLFSLKKYYLKTLSFIGPDF